MKAAKVKAETREFTRAVGRALRRAAKAGRWRPPLCTTHLCTFGGMARSWPRSLMDIPTASGKTAWIDIGISAQRQGRDAKVVMEAPRRWALTRARITLP
jgi:hypothetical protein